MPAARHDVGQLGPAHEGGVVAVAARALLYRAAQQQHRVGGLEAGQRRKGELELAGAELDLERPQRQAEGFQILSQDLHDRVDQIVALLGEVLIAGGEELDFGWCSWLAGVGGLEVRVENLEDVELHFEAGDELVPKGLDCFAQELPRAVRHGAAILELQFAKKPSRVGRPGQHAERRGIGDHQYVGRALHLRHADAAARREGRKHGLVRRVLEEQRARHGDAALERRLDLRNRQRLAAKHAVLVGKRKTHRLQAVELGAAH